MSGRIHKRVPVGTADLSSPIYYDFPFPPSVNGYWRMFRNQMVISKRGREYKQEIIDQTPTVRCIRDPVILIVTFHPPTLQKRDLDNYPKSLLDAMADTGIIENDHLIWEMHTRWGHKIKEGLSCVTFMKHQPGFWDRLFMPLPATALAPLGKSQ